MYFGASVYSPISKFVKILEVAVEVEHVDGWTYCPYYAFTLYFLYRKCGPRSR
jgi:hypothetical protein